MAAYAETLLDFHRETEEKLRDQWTTIAAEAVEGARHETALEIEGLIQSAPMFIEGGHSDKVTKLEALKAVLVAIRACFGSEEKK
jgi:hypothetical protein